MQKVLAIAIIATTLNWVPAAARAQSLGRWLAIGDSITQHGAKADLGWVGDARGMAASSLDKDYVHQLQKMLQAKVPTDAQEIDIVGRLGKLSAGTMDQMVTVIDNLKDWKADLVTIQLGENDNLKEIGADGFEARYRALVDGLLAGGKHPVILCTGVWSPGEALDPTDPKRYLPGRDGAVKDAIIEKICRARGLIFVPVAAIAATPANSGTGESDGVRWHPNDSAMHAYASAMSAALLAPGRQQVR